MSKKSDSDREVANERAAREQGGKQAREDSAGRGDQTVVDERGGQQAVEKNRERREVGRPTDDKARTDRDIESIQHQQRREGDVTYADATGERQPTIVDPDGNTTTQPPTQSQQPAPRSLAEGGVHPHGETP